MSDHQQEAYHKIRIQAAARPSGCPVDHHFTPFDADYLRDPYPQLERLSEQQPVFYAEQLGYLVVTRMEDILDVFKNPDVYSSENVQDPVFPLCERAQEVLSVDDYNPVAVMSNCQRPDHTRIRRFTREGFSSRRMKILEPYIRQRSDHLIDEMIQHGSPADLVSKFSHPLPGQIIFRFIGFPADDDAKLIRWTSNRLAFTWGRPSEAEQVEIAENMLRYWRYCREFVARRKTDPADDFTSELLAAQSEHPEELSLREVESVVYGLSFAGHEIVRNYITNAMWHLLSNREHWNAICRDTQLITNAMEEVLRFDSPQTSWRRITTQDTTLAGIDIPKGTQIFLSLGAANHEQAMFPDPSTFDIHRTNAGKHVSFGAGIHFCLGALLARREGVIAVESLARRIPGLRLTEHQTLQWAPNITFRGPTQLLVEWDSADV